jgi:hypothetical protein
MFFRDRGSPPTFAASRRLQKQGVRWQVRANRLQTGELIWRATGNLLVVDRQVQFIPQRGQTIWGAGVQLWVAHFDEIKTIDVVTPNAKVDVPVPHLRIVISNGKEELFTVSRWPETEVATSLREVISGG